ncbi:MAG: hypothetical protein JXB18_13275 [Sedimentisphaerales bacterium]|nr:hypothetical protein [Sedimentisphaerales bacterium]
MSPKRPKKRRPYVKEVSHSRMFKEMTNKHVDVLQNIESAIIGVYQDNENLDDYLVACALHAAIHSNTTDHELSNQLIQSLEEVRLLRLDISDTIWIWGLKVVLDSVHTHSGAQSGDTDYLNFISDYV